MAKAMLAGVAAGTIVTLVTKNLAPLIATSLFCPMFVGVMPPKRDTFAYSVGLAAVFAVGYAVCGALFGFFEHH